MRNERGTIKEMTLGGKIAWFAGLALTLVFWGGVFGVLTGCGKINDELVGEHIDRICNVDFYYQNEIGVYTVGENFRDYNYRSHEYRYHNFQVLEKGTFISLRGERCEVNIQEVKQEHGIYDPYAGYDAY